MRAHMDNYWYVMAALTLFAAIWGTVGFQRASSLPTTKVVVVSSRQVASGDSSTTETIVRRLDQPSSAPGELLGNPMWSRTPTTVGETLEARIQRDGRLAVMDPRWPWFAAGFGVLAVAFAGVGYATSRRSEAT